MERQFATERFFHLNIASFFPIWLKWTVTKVLVQISKNDRFIHFKLKKKIERTEMSIRAEMIESNARSSQGHVWPTHVNPFDSSFVCCYLSGAKSRISFRNSATAELIIHRTIPPHLKKSAFNNNNSIIWSGRTVILQEIRYSNQNRQDTSVYISDPLEI